MTTRVKLRKIYSNHNSMRDDLVEGIAVSLPEIGEPFVLIAPARDNPDAAFRRVNTSRIQQMTVMDGVYRFITESGSVYEVDVRSDLDADDR